MRFVRRMNEIFASLEIRGKKIADLSMALDMRYNFVWRILSGYDPPPPKFEERCRQAFEYFDDEKRMVSAPRVEVARVIKKSNGIVWNGWMIKSCPFCRKRHWAGGFSATIKYENLGLQRANCAGNCTKKTPLHYVLEWKGLTA
jgi:hypothetical protein